MKGFSESSYGAQIESGLGGSDNDLILTKALFTLGKLDNDC